MIWYKISVLFSVGRVRRAVSGCANSDWDQNEIEKLPTLDKICTHPIVKARIYNVGGLQLFCNSSGSTSRLLPWTLQQLISEKGGKPHTNPVCKPCAWMSQTPYVIGIFHWYQPVSNTPTIVPVPFPDQIEPLCVPSHHTKFTGRSHIPYPETNQVSHTRIFLDHDLVVI